ncbi:hypothetical protein EGW08_008244 [Elysia chlorotica]|uniref:Uncharacterized protein n=1 Tax=Elysia chlorotica TaxID=188477 RepID=A0A3S0ZVJ5_ELYCH|nr:hypothetical protein EGW08_008244 [Elysia chlorotica]
MDINYDYARVYYYFNLKRKPLDMDYKLNMLVFAVVYYYFKERKPLYMYDRLYILVDNTCFRLKVFLAEDLPTGLVLRMSPPYRSAQYTRDTLENSEIQQVAQMYTRTTEASYTSNESLESPLSDELSFFNIVTIAFNTEAPALYKFSHAVGEEFWCLGPYLSACPQSENQNEPQVNGRSIYSNNIYRPTANGNTKTEHSNGEGNSSKISRQKQELTRKLNTLNSDPVTDQSTHKDVSHGEEITWKTVSMVLDGFLLRFYSIFLAVSSVVFMAMLMNESEIQNEPQTNGRSIYSNNIYRPTANGNAKTDHSNGEGNSSKVSRQKQELTRKLNALNSEPVIDQSTPKDESHGEEITWKTVSMVLDGFLLRFYSIFLAVSSVVFMAMLMNG